MQIYNNTAAFSVWQQYNLNANKLQRSMGKLSTGVRITNAGDDPSGLAISERLRAQYRNTSAAANNVQNKLNYLQTADAWLQKIQDMLGRMAELTTMANDGTKSAVDRANLQQEFQQMQAEIKRITSGATAAGKFNGQYLFRGGSGTATGTGDAVVGGASGGAGRAQYVGAAPGSTITPADAGLYRVVRDSRAPDGWRVYHPNGSQIAGLTFTPGADGAVTVSGAGLGGAQGFEIALDAPTIQAYKNGDTFSVRVDTIADTLNNGAPPTLVRGVAGHVLSLANAGTPNSVTDGVWRAVKNDDIQPGPIPPPAVGTWTVYRNNQVIDTAYVADGTVELAAGGVAYGLAVNDTQAVPNVAAGDTFAWTTDGIGNNTAFADDYRAPYLQVGADGFMVFEERPVNLEADNFEVIGSFVNYSYGSVGMTVLGSGPGMLNVRWASLLSGDHLSIADQAAAQEGLAKINLGIDFISSKRAVVGAEMRRLEQTLSSLRSYEENARATESRIRDTDTAHETTVYAKHQILVQIDTAMLAQANALPQSVLQLVGGGGAAAQ